MSWYGWHVWLLLPLLVWWPTFAVLIAREFYLTEVMQRRIDKLAHSPAPTDPQQRRREVDVVQHLAVVSGGGVRRARRLWQVSMVMSAYTMIAGLVIFFG